MRYIALMLVALVTATGCASVDTTAQDISGKATTGKDVQEVVCILGIEPGVSTRVDVLEKMGKPYISQPLNAGRYQWIYMDDTERQTVFTFAADRVVEITSSLQYGSPVNYR